MTSTKDTIIAEIIEADLQTLFNLIEPLKEETNELEDAYKAFKYGIKIKYHIEWNLREIHETRERQGTVILRGQTYDIEEWWDEEEARRSICRKALLEHYQDDQPYEAR